MRVEQALTSLGRFQQKTEMRYGFGESLGGEKLTLAAQYREGTTKPEELVFFIHGLGCNKDSFRDMWNRDEYKKRSILIPDLAGFGDSSKPEAWSYRLEDHAASLKKLLDNPRYNDKKIHLVGHSTGGSIGVLLAEMLDQEEKLASVTLLEPNLVITDSSDLSRNIAKSSIRTVKERILPSLSANLCESDSPSLRLWGEQVAVADPIALWRTAQSLVALSDSGELMEKFGAIKAQKWYVFGTAGERWNKEDEKGRNSLLEKGFGQRKIPYVGILGASHFIMNDKPEAFYGWHEKEVLASV